MRISQKNDTIFSFTIYPPKLYLFFFLYSIIGSNAALYHYNKHTLVLIFIIINSIVSIVHLAKICLLPLHVVIDNQKIK